MAKAGTKTTLECSKSLCIIRNHGDLELLISRWNTQTHTFMAAWGEFVPSLEDVVVIARLPVFEDRKAMVVVLKGEDKEMLQFLTSALLSLRTSGNPPMRRGSNISTRENGARAARWWKHSYHTNCLILSSKRIRGSQWLSSS